MQMMASQKIRNCKKKRHDWLGVRIILSGMRHMLFCCPAITIYLFIYMGLPSRIIHPYSQNFLWQEAYFGWWDLVLFCVGSEFLLRHRGWRWKDIGPYFVLLLAIVVSHLASSLVFDFEALLASIVFWGRSFFCYSIASIIVRRYGFSGIYSIVISIWLMLCVSVIYVIAARSGVLNRIYGSG